MLIITYYWPPGGGSGVQRWLKFVKYLPTFGWEPYVFTPENPSYSIQDNSLMKDVPDEAEVIHFPIWEPYDFFFKLSRIFGNRTAAKPDELVSIKKKTLFQVVTTWIRGNVFIPDPRVFWVKPSVKFLTEFLEANNIQTIITTGPPHSLHLIGLKLKKNKLNLRWIADFRDPWSEWGLLDSLLAGKLARKYHKSLETKVLLNADDVITITPFYVRRFQTLGNRKVHLITNGFDDDDFKSLEIKRAEKFIIRHVGIINEKCDPRPFMQALELLCRQDPRFAKDVQVEFIGAVHPAFRQFVSDSDFLNRVSVFSDNIPHQELMKMYGSSSMLLLILTGYKDAEGYMPGKLFEYIATGLPVLGVGPVYGDAAALLKETQAGEMVDSYDSARIKKSLLNHYSAWVSGTVAEKKHDGRKYSRKAITGELTKLLSSGS